MAYEPHKGSCLLVPFNGVNHLFVVLNDPDQDGNCLLVMVSSVKPNRAFDPACLLNEGDHEFIRHESYVVYALASETRAAHISNMVEKGYYQERSDARPEVLHKICLGLYISDETRPAIVRHAKKVAI